MAFNKGPSFKCFCGIPISLPMLLFIWSVLFSFVSHVSCILINIRGLGSVQGIRDSSTNTYAFLGIPYAKSPVGPHRFMPPERHYGWNTTLDAGRYGPNCLQPTARGHTSEDCLFLNIWTPQYASAQRSLLPVVIFIGGDLYTFFDSSVYSGAELSALDLVVVTFNYRLGVYGFFSMEDSRSGGNMGLLDQYLAIEWVHENIREFGGDPSKVTLMGHSAGAASAMMHMTSPRAAGRFQAVILMSGSSLAPWAMGYRVKDASHQLAKELGCSTSNTEAIMSCLRLQDANRITQAYYRVIDFYNGTDVFGPVVDTYLPKDVQYIARTPWEALEKGEFPKIPVISGISSKDGLLMIKRKPQLYRMSSLQLKYHFETELIPQLLERSRLQRNWMVVKEVVKFAFITGASNDTTAVMDQMLDFFTEANFLAPHIQTAQYFSQHLNPVYTYVFDQETPDPNVYSSSINSTGAWHGSILLYLFGRSVFQEIIGRDFNGIERSVSTRIQELWTNFVMTRVPSESRSSSWSQWTKFTSTEPVHFWLRDGRITPRGYQPYRTQFWTEFLPRLNYLGYSANGLGPYGDSLGIPQEYREGASTAYKSATWILVGLVLILMTILLLVLSVLRRRRKEQEFTSRETSPEVTGSRSPLPSPSPHPSRAGRSRPRSQDQGVTILY
ncbi:unnamed protein product [Allacma fusca]|uniref:Carboxylic ester hydrolase n=1 Tax=Allacma fusca TaxID=39272 RepID=A0A8J2L5E3_9HEXA|nr:unnamed protein product [Allacma fusca]